MQKYGKSIIPTLASKYLVSKIQNHNFTWTPQRGEFIRHLALNLRKHVFKETWYINICLPGAETVTIKTSEKMLVKFLIIMKWRQLKKQYLMGELVFKHISFRLKVYIPSNTCHWWWIKTNHLCNKKKMLFLFKPKWQWCFLPRCPHSALSLDLNTIVP